MSGFVNLVRTGSGSAPSGVAQSERRCGKTLFFLGKIKKVGM